VNEFAPDKPGEFCDEIGTVFKGVTYVTEYNSGHPLLDEPNELKI
jgi:hypothetical protein